MSSNIPANPTYGVYISQLITISRICDTFQSFVIRHRLLTERLIKQGFWHSNLCKFFKKFVRRRNALFSYGVIVRTHVHEGICPGTSGWEIAPFEKSHTSLDIQQCCFADVIFGGD